MVSFPTTTNSILLATAKVEIRGASDSCLFDQGLEATFISESVIQSLFLPKCRFNASLTGISASQAGNASSIMRFKIHLLSAPNFSL